mmetsp:Transcript_43595/g.85997  ORF Transcript_43595/g.85997 Transcript_43595/m.85997 type:complete len:192 (-) Transcript_43595:302-877(-)
MCVQGELHLCDRSLCSELSNERRREGRKEGRKEGNGNRFSFGVTQIVMQSVDDARAPTSVREEKKSTGVLGLTRSDEFFYLSRILDSPVLSFSLWMLAVETFPSSAISKNKAVRDPKADVEREKTTVNDRQMLADEQDWKRRSSKKLIESEQKTDTQMTPPSFPIHPRIPLALSPMHFPSEPQPGKPRSAQ